MSTSAPPTPVSLWRRAPQILPEDPEPVEVDFEGSFSNNAVPTALDTKFSAIATRSFQLPGICKVLVADDSKVHVKILIKVLKSICTPNSNMRSNIGHGSVPMSSVHQGGNGASSLAAAAAVYTFSEAEDGDVAVQMVQDASDAGAPFDIVFMDNIMIHMHGPEAAQLMRSNGFKGLIVGVTGNVMAPDLAHYLASGADCVLDKPVNVEDLTIVLKKLL